MTLAYGPGIGLVRSFSAGLALAVVACGGILADRLSLGDVRVALIAHVTLTLAVLAIVHVQARRPTSNGWGAAPGLGAQLVGAAFGIVLAHWLIRSSPVAATPWLSEGPAQLVNDAVAVFAPLAIAWASTRRPPSTVVLLATLLLVTVYRLTGGMWHLDAARFSYSVQDLVTGELAGCAIGITAFRLLAPA